MRCHLRAFMYFVCLFPFTSVTAWAQTTVNVPADQPTIQAGIDAAQDGDTVLVASGVYQENINFNGKAITVASASGAAQTTIDGGATNSVVIFHSNETTAAVLRGFTITNGKALNGTILTEAGGIDIVASSPTIQDNIITANNGCEGNGVYINSGSPIIRDNSITHNFQQACAGGGGGGILVHLTAHPQVIGNIITDNQTGTDGGGIAIDYGASPTIESNYIARNSAQWGGGISLDNGSSLLVNNLVVSNSATYGGGGLYLSASSNAPVFLNNTVADNDAPDGSVIYANGYISATVAITNNILISKAAEAAVDCQQFASTVPLLFTNNDVYSAGGSLFGGACSDQTGINGNISSDPKFANVPAGDYHLSAGSPAIDTGTNAAIGIPGTDYDGNARIVASTPTGSAIVDMGSLEFAGLTTISVSPTSLGFPVQKVGTSSPGQVVTVTNTGSVTLHVAPLQIGPDFQQTNTCEEMAGVEAGQSCSITVVFQPVTSGSDSEQVVITPANGTAATAVELSGTTDGPTVSLSPTSLTFGDQALSTSSAAQQVTVTNVGNQDLVISSVSAGGDFVQTNNCTTVAPNASCTISVTFTPKTAGSRTASLVIKHNAPGSLSTIALSGKATDFSISSTAGGPNPSQTVTAGQTATFNLSIAGTDGFSGVAALTCGNLPSLATCALSTTSIALNGTTPIPFSVTVSTMPASAGLQSTPGPGGPAYWNQGWGALLLGMLLAVVLRKQRVRAAFACTAIAFLLLVSGCGGGSSTPASRITNPGTPAGSYTIIVTATSNNIARTINLSLTVK